MFVRVHITKHKDRIDVMAGDTVRLTEPVSKGAVDTVYTGLMYDDLLKLEDGWHEIESILPVIKPPTEGIHRPRGDDPKKGG